MTSEVRKQQLREANARWKAKNKEKVKQRDREYSKRYREQNPDINKKWREENKAYWKDWREKNKDMVKKYRATPKVQRIHTISNWKYRGIKCDEEWSDVYDWYSETTQCDICDEAFKDSSDKCLDHDHTISGYNIRGILCRSCNLKDMR